MFSKNSQSMIREARSEDFEFVVSLMGAALAPYYGGDHKAHAERIFSTHISGGKDNIGHFSFEQKMFIITVDDEPAGMLHLVGKRQGNYKISPIIITPKYRGNRGLGTKLLEFGEEHARNNHARQMYCTVAEQNNSALQFFLRNGYITAGRSDSHYKAGITEIMLYKLFTSEEFEEGFDRPHISVLPFEDHYEPEVRKLLFEHLPQYFFGITEEWADALFTGFRRRDIEDVNRKFKLIYVAVDRADSILGVVGATPKKGKPIKIMPFIATTLPAFVALLSDVPFELKKYGHKLYMHISPTVEQTIALQQRSWRLDAAMPAGYHSDHVTQQWSLEVKEGDFMRMIRVKKQFLDQIMAGKKTLEVRVGYSNIRTIQPGERIRMTSRTEEQVIRVNDIREYRSHAEMLNVEDHRRIAPHISSKEKLLELLQEIYPPRREKLGIIVLEIEKGQRP